MDKMVGTHSKDKTEEKEIKACWKLSKYFKKGICSQAIAFSVLFICSQTPPPKLLKTFKNSQQKTSL